MPMSSIQSGAAHGPTGPRECVTFELATRARFSERLSAPRTPSVKGKSNNKLPPAPRSVGFRRVRRPSERRPPKATPDYRARLVEVMRTSPKEFGYPLTVWTVARLRAHMAREVDVLISETRVRQIMKEERLVFKAAQAHTQGQAQRRRLPGRPRPPGPVQKKSLEPHPGVEFLYLDESWIHLHPHLVRMWQAKGETVEIPAPGKNRKFPVYCALNYRTNRVSHRVGTGKNSRNLLAFLAQLALEYRGRRCVLVLDNASYHTSIVVAQYLREMTDTFEVAWLPSYCPELNDIERIWKYVKGAAMANYDFGEVTSLREAVDLAFEYLNRHESNDLGLHLRNALANDLPEAALEAPP